MPLRSPPPGRSRVRWPVAVFVLWSVYVWVTRIVNAMADESENQPFALALSLSVLVPAVATGVVVVRARHRPLVPAEARLWRAFAGWTALVWLVRGAEITLDDHSVGFKVVHVVIGVISIVLAAATVRAARPEVQPGGHEPGTGPGVGSSPLRAGR